MTDNSASEATTNVPQGEAGLEHGAQPSTIGSPTHVGEPSSANATARPPSASSYSGTVEWKIDCHYPYYQGIGEPWSEWRRMNNAFSQRVGGKSQWIDDSESFATNADRMTLHVLPVMPLWGPKPKTDISMALETQAALAGAMRVAAHVISVESHRDLRSRIEGIYHTGSAFFAHCAELRANPNRAPNPDRLSSITHCIDTFKEAAESEWLVFKDETRETDWLEGLERLSTLLEKEDGDFLIWSGKNDGDNLCDVFLKVHQPAEDGHDDGSEDASSA